ncbi:hypothetical protein [Kitasatospora cineracea]|uniref:hypothetical protein n=1 Tax=Kitasatospora cineracea TaxID=88074 RepID=UPI0013C34C21|nr:hypothetical protein [Kitasatospora cineracea]
MSSTRVWALLLGGSACLLLALATGAATTAALRYGHSVRGPAVLAAATYATGVVLLLAARLLGGGRAPEPGR